MSGFTSITSRVGLPVICNLRPEHCKLRPVAELAQENRRERDREARAPTAPAVLWRVFSSIFRGGLGLLVEVFLGLGLQELALTSNSLPS